MKAKKRKTQTRTLTLIAPLPLPRETDAIIEDLLKVLNKYGMTAIIVMGPEGVKRNVKA